MKHQRSRATKTILPSGRMQTNAVRSSGASGSKPKAKWQVTKSTSKELLTPERVKPTQTISAPAIVASESRNTPLLSSSTVTRSGVCSSCHRLKTEIASSGVGGKGHRPRFVPSPKFPHFVKLTIRRAMRQMRRLAALQASKRGQSTPPASREFAC